MIRMLTSTYYNGKQYQQGKTYSIDKKTKERWVKNGIAIVDNTDSIQSGYEKDQERQKVQEELTKKYYDSMTDKQLAEIAEQKGIDLTKIKSRAQLIKALEK